jgi:hypothetical protein
LADIIKIEKKAASNVLELFAHNERHWPVLLDNAFKYGAVLSDDALHPSAAVAFISGCVLFAGDPESENAEAIIKSFPVLPLILPTKKSWLDAVRKIYGNAAKPITRYRLSDESLDVEILNELDLSVGDGFEIKRVDLSISQKMQDVLGVEYHLRHYDSLEQFVELAKGYAVTHGDELCAVTAAFLRTDTEVEIQTNTAEQYRRRGFALKTAAATLMDFIYQDIAVCWDASNTMSRDLAKKLGYTECETYECLQYFP